MLSKWLSIQVPVIIVQGEEDRLVNPANADFAERMLKDCATVVRVAEQDHFILWDQPGLIRNQILTLLEESRD